MVDLAYKYEIVWGVRSLQNHGRSWVWNHGSFEREKKGKFDKEFLQMAQNNSRQLDKFGHIYANLNEKVIF